MSSPVDEHSDIAVLAAEIANLPRPMLIAFDCDGVLSPIVEHADDARLLDGVGRLLELTAAIEGVDVAIVSGRSLAGLEQFDFAGGLIVVGSHGAERSGRPMPPLTEVEGVRLSSLEVLATDAVVLAGVGAWVERKPASVVLHVREADPALGQRAVMATEALAASVRGAEIKPGSHVLELLARPTDKGRALIQLREECSSASVVFIGDDVTDEDAFSVLEPGDLGVKVGPGETMAGHRLPDTASVRDLLTILADPA